MKDSKLVILPSVVLEIILEVSKSILKYDLIFVDEFFSVPIKDFGHSIISSNVRSFGIYNFKTKKRVGILTFANDYCYKLKPPRKIVWKIKLNAYDLEKEAKRVVEVINKIYPDIRSQILIEGNK